MKIKILLIICLLTSGLAANGNPPTDGSIKGVVRESVTRKKMAGVKIDLLNTDRIAVSDENGEFHLENVQVGSYNMRFTIPDCRPIVKTDIMVQSKRITFLDYTLNWEPVMEKSVTVSAGYFEPTQEQTASVTKFSFEEIRRAPGSGGDISRVLTNLPSTAMVSDKDNGLAVRGGSPLENSFYIDNIPIPHINHFPNWGSSGGAIGLLNVDFIQNANFYCGGFSPLFGDRLSSVLDIEFREGNREEMDWQLDMNMAGLGLLAEGPLFNGKGSWLFSARKSYVDLILGAIGTGVAPHYNDFQGKVVIDISSRNKLSFLGIAGFDSIRPGKENALETGDDDYGEFNSQMHTYGVNWFWMWSDKGFSNTSCSFSHVKFNESWFITDTDATAHTNNSYDNTIVLRNTNHINFSHAHRLQIGFELTYLLSRQHYFTRQNYDTYGKLIPEITVKNSVESSKQGIFANYTVKPFRRLHLNLGIRGDHFAYNDNMTVSPRLSLTWQFARKTSLRASAGIFHQNLPLVMLYKSNAYRDLKNPQAHHYILGIDHMLNDHTKLTLELYDKEYRHFPMALDQPLSFPCDDFVFYRNSSAIQDFVDSGQARSYGVELTIQKKLATKLYGIFSASFFKTRYRDLNGTWRDRSFDNQYLIAVQGGYKPNRFWEFSTKWIYAGGAPYTPYNMEQSLAINEGVYDLTRINEIRYPDYHSLNIRLDRRFYFRGSGITLFFSLWNAYNQKNIWYYYWDSKKKGISSENQMSLLPILGIEFEF